MEKFTSPALALLLGSALIEQELLWSSHSTPTHVLVIKMYSPGHTYRPHSFQTLKPPSSSLSWTLKHKLDILHEREGLHDLISGVLTFALGFVVVQDSAEEYEEPNDGENGDDHVVLRVPGPAVDVAVRTTNGDLNGLLSRPLENVAQALLEEVSFHEPLEGGWRVF